MGVIRMRRRLAAAVALLLMFGQVVVWTMVMMIMFVVVVVVQTRGNRIVHQTGQGLLGWYQWFPYSLGQVVEYP